MPFLRPIAALILAVLVGAALAQSAAADPNFPTLSGRVVDQANVLSPDTRSALTAKLKDLEEKSGIQLVVATVSTLDGLEVEREFHDFVARIFQHEDDHLRGIVFLDRLESTRDVIAEKEYHKKFIS